MRNYINNLKNEKFLCFVGGVATIILGKKVLNCSTTRKFCVSTIAKAIKLKSEAQEAFENIKEDAQDLCFDAQEEAGKSCCCENKEAK